ncbi:MAG: hypothetical protein COA84_15365 [Robiginitomaculum sp.]|nr:MAG: hypothetical protein COA84_15365 [Robiginitomaculum sp.]
MSRSLKLCFIVFSFVFVGLLSASPVWGQDDTVEARAMAALEQALADTESRYAASKDVRMAFTTRIETGDEDNPLVEFSYDPALPEGERSVLIHPSEAENPKARKKIMKQRAKALKQRVEKGEEAAQPDRDLYLENPRKLLSDGAAKFTREEGGNYVFSFQPAFGAVNFGGGDDEDEGKKKKGKDKDKKDFSTYLLGEMSVSKDPQRLTGVRFYAPESFKPVAIAKIKKFEINMQIAPAWEDGPMISALQEVTVSGKAMFKAFEQHSVVTNSGFEKR